MEFTAEWYKINKQQPQQQQVYFKLSKAYKACASNLAKAIWGGSTREKRKFEQKKWNGTQNIFGLYKSQRNLSR